MGFPHIYGRLPWGIYPSLRPIYGQLTAEVLRRGHIHDVESETVTTIDESKSIDISFGMWIEHPFVSVSNSLRQLDGVRSETCSNPVGRCRTLENQTCGILLSWKSISSCGFLSKRAADISDWTRRSPHVILYHLCISWLIDGWFIMQYHGISYQNRWLMGKPRWKQPADPQLSVVHHGSATGQARQKASGRHKPSDVEEECPPCCAGIHQIWFRDVSTKKRRGISSARMENVIEWKGIAVWYDIHDMISWYMYNTLWYYQMIYNKFWPWKKRNDRRLLSFFSSNVGT